MVHALHEARRVLKPHSILIDLRPAVAHRQVGIVSAGHYTRLGRMHDCLDQDRAADQAIASALREGLFESRGRIRFEVRRVYGTFAEFRDAICESVQAGSLTSYKRMMRRAEMACGESRNGKIVTKGPLVLTVLAKRTGYRERG